MLKVSLIILSSVHGFISKFKFTKKKILYGFFSILLTIFIRSLFFYLEQGFIINPFLCVISLFIPAFLRGIRSLVGYFWDNYKLYMYMYMVKDYDKGSPNIFNTSSTKTLYTDTSTIHKMDGNNEGLESKDKDSEENKKLLEELPFNDLEDTSSNHSEENKKNLEELPFNGLEDTSSNHSEENKKLLEELPFNDVENTSSNQFEENKRNFEELPFNNEDSLPFKDDNSNSSEIANGNKNRTLSSLSNKSSCSSPSSGESVFSLSRSGSPVNGPNNTLTREEDFHWTGVLWMQDYSKRYERLNEFSILYIGGSGENQALNEDFELDHPYLSDIAINEGDLPRRVELWGHMRTFLYQLETENFNFIDMDKDNNEIKTDESELLRGIILGIVDRCQKGINTIHSGDNHWEDLWNHYNEEVTSKKDHVDQATFNKLQDAWEKKVLKTQSDEILSKIDEGKGKGKSKELPLPEQSDLDSNNHKADNGLLQNNSLNDKGKGKGKALDLGQETLPEEDNIEKEEEKMIEQATHNSLQTFANSFKAGESSSTGESSSSNNLEQPESKGKVKQE